MSKYLAKPTKIIDKKGLIHTVEDLKCDGEHSGGTTSGECNFTTSKQSQLNEASQKAELALTNANEAKTTANAAHSIASGLQEAVGNAESTAVKAQEKALEAYNSLHSLNADYENLKGRVEDLEETDGQASEPIVGKSKMGYVPDFTDYGLPDKHEVYVELGDEGRSLTFDSNTVLGDVVEELMYCTATGITNHHNRLTALENGSGGSDTPLAKQTMGAESKGSFPIYFKNPSGDQLVTELKYDSTNTLEKVIFDTQSCLYDVTVCQEARISTLESKSGGNVDLTQINNTLASHTNSIQSLDTRSSSNTAAIGQLENRMTDVEVQSSANKNNIASHSLRIDALENGVVSGSDPISVYEIRTANDMYGNLVYMDVVPSALYKVNDAISQVNSNTYENYKMIDHYVNLIQTNVKNKLTSLKEAMVSDLNYIWSTLREKYPDLPQIGVGGADATDWNVSGVEV